MLKVTIVGRLCLHIVNSDIFFVISFVVLCFCLLHVSCLVGLVPLSASFPCQPRSPVSLVPLSASFPCQPSSLSASFPVSLIPLSASFPFLQMVLSCFWTWVFLQPSLVVSCSTARSSPRFCHDHCIW